MTVIDAPPIFNRQGKRLLIRRKVGHEESIGLRNTGRSQCDAQRLTSIALLSQVSASKGACLFYRRRLFTYRLKCELEVRIAELIVP